MSFLSKLHLINELKRKSDDLKPSKSWDQSFLERIKIEFTYASNKIEGNTITYGQTVKLLKDFVTPKGASAGEVLDLVNHQMVLNTVFKNYHSKDFSEENIKDLHRVLMKNIEQWADDGLYSPGNYKSFENVTVRSTGKIHSFMPPTEVPAAMEALIKGINFRLQNTNFDDASDHTLVIATDFHQRFLNEIHPFADGNGRIGRIFMNLILLKKGFPPIFIKDIDRIEYLKRFEMSDIVPDAMLDFMADRLIESLKIRIEAFEANPPS